MERVPEVFHGCIERVESGSCFFQMDAIQGRFFNRCCKFIALGTFPVEQVGWRFKFAKRLAEGGDFLFRLLDKEPGFGGRFQRVGVDGGGGPGFFIGTELLNFLF